MSKSIFENIPTSSTPEEESVEKMREEKINKTILAFQKKQKEHIESEEPPKLIDLKLQERFLVPDSDTPNRLYSVAVKYEDNRIEAIQVGTLNRFVFDGDTIVIPKPKEEEMHG